MHDNMTSLTFKIVLSIRNEKLDRFKSVRNFLNNV